MYSDVDFDEMDLVEWERNKPDRCATVNEAIQEYAENVGVYFPDREYLLTSWDTWVKNPYYVGPPGRHPDDWDD